LTLWNRFNSLFLSEQQKHLRELKYQFESILDKIPTEGAKSKGYIEQAFKTIEKRLSQNKHDEASIEILENVEDEIKKLMNMIREYTKLKKEVLQNISDLLELTNT